MVLCKKQEKQQYVVADKDVTTYFCVVQLFLYGKALIDRKIVLR